MAAQSRVTVIRCTSPRRHTVPSCTLRKLENPPRHRLVSWSRSPSPSRLRQHVRQQQERSRRGNTHSAECFGSYNKNKTQSKLKECGAAVTAGVRNTPARLQDCKHPIGSTPATQSTKHNQTTVLLRTGTPARIAN